MLWDGSYGFPSLSEKTTRKSNRLQVLVRPGFEMMLIFILLDCESMKFLLRKSFCSLRKGKSRNFLRCKILTNAHLLAYVYAG